MTAILSTHALGRTFRTKGGPLRQTRRTHAHLSTRSRHTPVKFRRASARLTTANSSAAGHLHILTSKARRQGSAPTYLCNSLGSLCVGATPSQD